MHGEVAFLGHIGAATGSVVAAVDGEGNLSVEGTETFDVRDWGFQVPRLGPLKVSPVVEVRIALSGRPA